MIHHYFSGHRIVCEIDSGLRGPVVDVIDVRDDDDEDVSLFSVDPILADRIKDAALDCPRFHRDVLELADGAGELPMVVV